MDRTLDLTDELSISEEALLLVLEDTDCDMKLLLNENMDISAELTVYKIIRTGDTAFIRSDIP